MKTKLALLLLLPLVSFFAHAEEPELILATPEVITEDLETTGEWPAEQAKAPEVATPILATDVVAPVNPPPATLGSTAEPSAPNVASEEENEADESAALAQADEEEEEAVAVIPAPVAAEKPPALGPTAEEGYGSVEMKNASTVVEVSRDTASTSTSKPGI